MQFKRISSVGNSLWRLHLFVMGRIMGRPAHMNASASARDRLSTARRVGRMFPASLHGRSTPVVVLLAALIVGVALAFVRDGTSLGAITGSESTDDAYVRADMITISSHIAS
jgi:hypothetical protein